MEMKIEKIFNNNVILLEDENQKEIIVMGKGIGFKKNRGEDIDFSKVDKKFVLSDSIADRFVALISNIPSEHLQVSNEIIEFAKKELGDTFNDNIYIALTDHISFALARFQEGIIIRNALFWEVKKFYKNEYEVAIKALDLIEREIGVRFPEDEAVSIALHFVNAQQSKGEHNMEKTVVMTKIMNDLLNIVKYHYGIQIDEKSLNYSRFMTHLQYFAHRILSDDLAPDTEDSLYEQVKEKYPMAYKCVQKIKAYLKGNFNKTLTKEEFVYFMIHIHRVTNRGNHNNA